MKQITVEIPLVYSCSGCSSAAQIANYLAIKMDRDGIAERQHEDFNLNQANEISTIIREKMKLQKKTGCLEIAKQ